MAYRDLRAFLARLEKEGELRRISAEVDPVLEITEVTDRVVKAGGPALLFERPKGSAFPVVTNLVGTERRMNLALEVDSLGDVAGRISSIPRHAISAGPVRQNEDVAETRRAGFVFPEDCPQRRMPGSGANRRFLAARFSDLAVLAAGWRPIHHMADGDHEESGNREAKRRLLSHAGL